LSEEEVKKIMQRKARMRRRGYIRWQDEVDIMDGNHLCY